MSAINVLGFWRLLFPNEEGNDMMGHNNPESSIEKVKRSSVNAWKGKPGNFIWDKVAFIVFLITVAGLIG